MSKPDYFHNELQQLKQGMQQFTQEHPQHAKQLGLQNNAQHNDPYAERLLQGTAYLAAKIRERIEDDLPDLTERLLAQVQPSLLKPMPAMTVLHLQPRIGQLQQPCSIPTATMFYTQNTGEKSAQATEEDRLYYFHTCSSLHINPLSIDSLSLHTSDQQVANAEGLLRFKLCLADNSEISLDSLKNLSFYIHAPQSQACRLQHALLTQVAAISISAEQGGARTAVNLGGQALISWPLLNSVDLTGNVSGAAAFDVVRRYFHCPEALRFITFDLSLAHTMLTEHGSIVVELQLRTLPETASDIKPEMLQLNCVPAINLCARDAQPILLDHTCSDYPLMIDSTNAQQEVIYSVDKVTGFDYARGKQTHYASLDSYTQLRDSAAYFYTLQKPNATHRQLHLAVMQSSDQKHAPPSVSNKHSIGETNLLAAQSLSCQLSVCQGDAPHAHIGQQAQWYPHQQLAQAYRVANLVRPTPMYEPCQRADYQWRLISQLGFHYQTLTCLDNLKALLNCLASNDNQMAKRQIEALQAITTRTINSTRQGCLQQGIIVHLGIDETAFAGNAEVYMFVGVLHAFFQHYAPLNYFITTKITCQISKEVFIWHPQRGKRQTL